MLSEIWRLMWNYECAHGVRPNVLHVSQQHLVLLQEDFCNEVPMEHILKILGVCLVISHDTVYPHVSRQPNAANDVR